MDEQAPILDATPAELPDKLFFRMGEVSRLVGVEPYVIRYWETEFKMVSPRKSSSGQRMFRRKDVELLLQIKHLLYDRKFTIEGARRFLLESRDKLKTGNRGQERQEELFAEPITSPLPQIRRALFEILEILR